MPLHEDTFSAVWTNKTIRSLTWYCGGDTYMGLRCRFVNEADDTDFCSLKILFIFGYALRSWTMTISLSLMCETAMTGQPLLVP
jgi:hypothetical protein